jgi:hypothetical protein
MGIAYRCDVESGLSVSVWHGETTPEERRGQLATLASDPEWAAGRLIVTDLTSVASGSGPGEGEIAETAAVFIERFTGSALQAKWAIVADHAYEHARAFGEQIEAAAPRVIVFNNLETGCAWLGVDAEVVRSIADDLRQEIRRSM